MKSAFLQGTRVFFIAIALAALYFSFFAVQGMLLYLRTKSTMKAETVNFYVQEGTWGRYYLEGIYKFTFKGSPYTGKTRLSQPVFLNQANAEEKAENAPLQKWTVYFDAANPKWSTLERVIPFREIVYAFLSWISLGYLIAIMRKING